MVYLHGVILNAKKLNQYGLMEWKDLKKKTGMTKTVVN